MAKVDKVLLAEDSAARLDFGLAYQISNSVLVQLDFWVVYKFKIQENTGKLRFNINETIFNNINLGLMLIRDNI